MRTALRLLMCALVTMGIATAAFGATITVRQDGTGDHVTIGGAVAAAASGDVIDVGMGTYFEGLVVGKSLTLFGSSGPSATVIDGQNADRILSVSGPVSCAVSGLQFAHGSAGYTNDGQGGAIRVIEGAQLAVDNCWFIENRSAWDAGAIWAYTDGVRVEVSNSRFERNHADWNGGACGVSTNAFLGIADCVFVDNVADVICGGVAAFYAQLSIERSLFARNRAQAAGAIRAWACNSTIRNNTVYDNTSPDHASVLFDNGGTCMLKHNIIAGDRAGFGVEFLGCTATRVCNLYFGNAMGSVAGGALVDGEIEADPLFCDWTADDYTLCILSPALPDKNTCGLIGAFGLGCETCGPVPTVEESWGGVKALYR